MAIRVRSADGNSLDHLVGEHERRRRNRQPERLCSREVDDEIELGRLLDWDIASPRPAQNLVDIAPLELHSRTVVSPLPAVGFGPVDGQSMGAWVITAFFPNRSF